MTVPTGMRSASGKGMNCLACGRRTVTVPAVGVAITLLPRTGGGGVGKPSMSNGGGGGSGVPAGCVGAAATVEVALSLCAEVVRLRCDTWHDSAWPTSPVAGAYVVDVAPVIGAPSSCHWIVCGAGGLAPGGGPRGGAEHGDAGPATGAGLTNGPLANEVGSLNVAKTELARPLKPLKWPAR